jgi:signal transduction histidine kinase
MKSKLTKDEKKLCFINNTFMFSFVIKKELKEKIKEILNINDLFDYNDIIEYSKSNLNNFTNKQIKDLYKLLF